MWLNREDVVLHYGFRYRVMANFIPLWSSDAVSLPNIETRLLMLIGRLVFVSVLADTVQTCR